MKVICHIMSSVDGRLVSTRWSAPSAEGALGEVLKEYSKAGALLGTDAWMWGKRTLTEVFGERYEPTEEDNNCNERAWKAERHSKRMFIVVDPDADILFTDNTLRGDDILTVIPSYTPCDYLMKLRRQGISYLMVDDTSDLAEIFTQIEREFDIHSVSLQGGGIINGAALQQQVLSELSLVVYPGIDGKSGVPSIFEYEGTVEHPAANQRLYLTSAESLNHGVVWMRYNVVNK